MITKLYNSHGASVTVYPRVTAYRSRLEIYGKSTDEKPTEDIQNADIFYEMDTQDVYLFDEETKTWLKQ